MKMDSLIQTVHMMHKTFRNNITTSILKTYNLGWRIPIFFGKNNQGHGGQNQGKPIGFQ